MMLHVSDAPHAKVATPHTVKGTNGPDCSNTCFPCTVPAVKGHARRGARQQLHRKVAVVHACHVLLVTSYSTHFIDCACSHGALGVLRFCASNKSSAPESALSLQLAATQVLRFQH